MAALLTLAVITGFGIYAWHFFDVPSWQRLDPARLEQPAQKGAIYDREGQYVTTLVGRENRTVVRLDTLPRHVVDAFLAAEDLRFYKHPGFDVTRIAGALVREAKERMRASGVTTVELQVVGGNLAGERFWRSQGMVPVRTIYTQNF